MLTAKLNVSTRVPVRLLNSSNVPVTGQLAVNVNGGVITIVKSDGSSVDVTLVNGTNWIEIDNVKAPGLYHVLVPGSALNIAGAAQLSIVPAASTFVASVVDFMVDGFASDILTILGSPAGASMSADIAGNTANITTIKNVSIGRWKVQGTQLLLYDTSNSLFKTFNLLDDNGNASSSNIFERAPV